MKKRGRGPLEKGIEQEGPGAQEIGSTERVFDSKNRGPKGIKQKRRAQTAL